MGMYWVLTFIAQQRKIFHQLVKQVSLLPFLCHLLFSLAFLAFSRFTYLS